MNSLQRSIKANPREMNTEDFLKKSYEFTKRSMSQKLRARDTSELKNQKNSFKVSKIDSLEILSRISK